MYGDVPVKPLTSILKLACCGLLSLLLGESVLQAQLRHVPEQLAAIRQLYVPQDQLEIPWQRDREGVLLSQREFAQLYQAARQAHEQSAGQLPGVIPLDARYVSRIEGDQLLAQLQLKLRTASEQPQVFSFRIGNWRIEQVGLQPAEADRPGIIPPLMRTGSQGEFLQSVVTGSGEQLLQLELSLPLTAVGSDQTVQVPLTGWPRGELQLQLPAGKSLLIDGLEFPRTAPQGEPDISRIPTGGLEQIELRITDRQQTSREDLLTFAQTAYGVSVQPGAISWVADTSLQVFGKSIDRLRCSVPGQLEITTVEAEGLEAWEMQDGAAGQTLLTLQFRQPFSGHRRIRFQGVMSVPSAQSWSVPNLQIEQITAHTATAVVSHPVGVRVQLSEMQGARAVAELDVPADLVVPGAQLRYQIWEENFRLSFGTAPKPLEVRAALTNILDLHSRWLDLYTTVNLETRFAPLFEARLLYPAQWMILQVTEGGTPVRRWTAVPTEHGQELRIELAEPLQPGGVRELAVTAMLQPEDWPVEGAAQNLELPQVELQQAAMVEALYGIVADAVFEVTPRQTTGLDAARQQDVDNLNRRLEGLGKQVRLGFSYQDRFQAGLLEVSRRPGALSVAGTNFIRLDPESLFLNLEANISARGGGMRELLFLLDERFGTDLRFELQSSGQQPLAVRIVEQLSEQPVAGQRLWKLQLDRYLVGSVLVTAQMRIPLTDPAAQVTVSGWKLLDAEQQTGFLAIEAAEDQRVQVQALSAAQGPLRQVDPVDFPAARYQPLERVIGSYQYVFPDWQLVLRGERFAKLPVPTAIGQLLKTRTLVGRGAELQHEATLEFAAVGIQSLLVLLPPEAHLWAVMLNEQPLEIRRHSAGYQVSLQSDADEAGGVLKLIYTTPAVGRGELVTTPARFQALTGDGAAQPLEVLEHRWELSAPETEQLFPGDGEFVALGDEPFGRGLFARLLKSLSPPSQARLYNSTLLLMGIAAGCLLLRLLIVRLGWWLFLLLGACGVVGLVALFGLSTLTREVYLGDLVTSAAPMSAGVEYDYGAVPPANKELSQPDWPAALPMSPGAAPGLGGAEFPPAAEPVPDTAPFRDNFQQMDRPVNGPGNRLELNEAVSQFGVGPSDAPTGANNPNQLQDRAALVGEGVNAGTAATGLGGRVAGGALLSMLVALDEPADYRTTEFTYRGDSLVPPELRVHLVDQQSLQHWFLLIVTGVVLVGWWLRQASQLQKAAWVLLTIAIPWSVAVLCPIRWQLLLEAVLLGGVLSLLSWCMYGVFSGGRRWCQGVGQRCSSWIFPERMSRRADTRASLWLLVGVLALTVASPAVAEDQPQQAPEFVPYVVIPYEPGTDPLSADKVFVPQQLYQKLWQLAHPAEHAGQIELRAGVVQAVYQAALVTDPTGSRIDVRARLIAVVPGPAAALDPRAPLPAGAIAQVQLPLGNVVLRSVQVNGTTATVQMPAADQLLVPMFQTGPQVIDVEFEIPVRLEGQLGSFSLELAAVPAAQLEFSLPAPELQVQLNHPSATYRRIRDEQEERLIVPVAAGGKFEFSWGPASAVAAVSGSLQAETAIAATVTDAGVLINQSVRVQPRQQPVNEISLEFPDRAVLRRIVAEDLGGWELNSADGKSTLKVFLRTETEREFRLDLELFHELSLTESRETVEIPTARVVQAARETGLLGLFAGDEFSLRVGKLSGLTQINAEAYQPLLRPTEHADAPLLAYRFVSTPVQLELSLARKAPEAVTLAEHGVVVGHRKLAVASRVHYELTGSPRPAVSLQLPADYLLLDAAAEGLVDWYVQEQAGERILTVEFEEPRLGQVTVVLDGRLSRPEGGAEPLAIELPMPLDVSRLTSTLAIWLGEGTAGVIGQTGNWRALDPDRISGELRALQATPSQFGFRTTELKPAGIVLQLQQATAELQADAITVAAVTDTTVDYGFTIRWKIQQGAVETFQFVTPDWLAGKLEVQVPGMRELRFEELEPGKTLWTVTFVEPVRQSLLLTAAATLPLPPPQPGDGTAPARGAEVNFPQLQFVQAGAAGLSPLELQRHFGILVNLSAAQLAPAPGEQPEIVAQADLPLKVNSDLVQQALAIVRLRPERLPVWQLEPLAEQQGPTATVLGADLLTAVEADGSWRTRATYIVRNRGRQFLALQLPEESRLLSVVVRGTPARATTAALGSGSIQLIALPQTSAAELSFDIEVVVSGRLPTRLPRGWTFRRSLIEIPVPEVVSPQQSSEFGLPVAQTLWRVYLPEGYHAEPLRDPARTNLTWHTRQDTSVSSQLLRLEALRNDAAAIQRLSREKILSLPMVFLCASNLESIEQTLQHTQVSQRGYRALTEAERQLAEQQQDLLREVQSSLFDLKQRFGESLVEAGQQVTPAETAGVQTGRRFIEMANSSNYLENREQPADESGGRSLALSFRKDSQKPGAGKKQEESDRSEVASSRGQLQERFQSQQAIQGNSLAGEYSQLEQRGAHPTLPAIQSSDGRAAAPPLNWNWSAPAGEMRQLEQTHTRDILQQQRVWDASGGLSLDFEIPVAGQEFSFSKSGGEPQLCFAVRPREFDQLLRGGVWGAVWLVLGFWACHWFARVTDWRSWLRVISVVLMIGGAVSYLYLPLSSSGLAAAGATLGAVLLTLSLPSKRAAA
jgi:hypothetical protein